MLIPFKTLIERYDLKPTGIFHVGASTGQEIPLYQEMGIEHMVFIEALPKVYTRLQRNLKGIPYAIAINACITDEDGVEVKFNIANNEGESSSIFAFGTHKEVHPEVRYTGTVQLTTSRVDTIAAMYNLDLSNYDFLNVDVQGAELLVLKGMGEELRKINFAYIEVNEKELYRGCPLVGEIDEYLFKYGLLPRETKMTTCGWGDKAYQRPK